MMRSIAATTGGRYYFPKDPRQLPSIFVKEAKELKRSMIQNVTFVPVADFPSPVMKGIDALPQLHGYVLTSPKPQAEIILIPSIDLLEHIVGQLRAIATDRVVLHIFDTQNVWLNTHKARLTGQPTHRKLPKV